MSEYHTSSNALLSSLPKAELKRLGDKPRKSSIGI